MNNRPTLEPFDEFERFRVTGVEILPLLLSSRKDSDHTPDLLNFIYFSSLVKNRVSCSSYIPPRKMIVFFHVGRTIFSLTGGNPPPKRVQNYFFRFL